VVTVKRFADACYKSEKSITRGVACPKDKESVQSCEEVIASLVEVKLRQF
jgi:hypothetical protein